MSTHQIVLVCLPPLLRKRSMELLQRPEGRIEDRGGK
jgi:hypothetical protein